jgi:hypothetical protein
MLLADAQSKPAPGLYSTGAGRVSCCSVKMLREAIIRAAPCVYKYVPAVETGFRTCWVSASHFGLVNCPALVAICQTRGFIARAIELYVPDCIRYGDQTASAR